MTFLRVRTLALVIGVSLFAAAEARAWGPDGHRIVCRIAFQLLKDDEPRRAKIARLTAAYLKPDHARVSSFFDGCTFPDEARSQARDHVPGWERFAAFEHWHFLNLPRSARTAEASQCHDDCVLTGLARHSAALANGANDQERAEALFFLGHWVGDIHQPLHVSYRDDLGGNNIKPITGGFYESGHLHAVWDSGIITKAESGNGWRFYADKLARSITAAEVSVWIAAQPIAWAQESYDVTMLPKVQYCVMQTANNHSTCAPIGGGRQLAQPYQTEFQDDVEMRLRQAGARLANLLRQHLSLP